MKKGEIVGEVVGSLNEDSKTNYAKTLSEALLKEHGRDFCAVLLKELNKQGCGCVQSKKV